MLITHSIFIACPTPQVWEATTDIDRWPGWAPTVQSVRRLDEWDFGIGSQVSIKQPLQPRTIWTVTAIDDGRYFVWETSGTAVRMRSTHRLDSYGGGTKCTLMVELIGPVAMICAVCLGPLIWFALAQENRGLKRWCEAFRRPRPTLTHHQPPRS